VYPYRNRLRWFLFGRYSHLVKAVNKRRRVIQDSTLEQRINSMRAWNSIRFGVALLLAPSVIAAVVSAYATQIPGGNAFLDSIVAASAALAGGLSVIYFLLTRHLGQLEIDILCILTIEHGS
jgi:hypothetical protein